MQIGPRCLDADENNVCQWKHGGDDLQGRRVCTPGLEPRGTGQIYNHIYALQYKSVCSLTYIQVFVSVINLLLKGANYFILSQNYFKNFRSYHFTHSNYMCSCLYPSAPQSFPKTMTCIELICNLFPKEGGLQTISDTSLRFTYLHCEGEAQTAV